MTARFAGYGLGLAVAALGAISQGANGPKHEIQGSAAMPKAHGLVSRELIGTSEQQGAASHHS